MSDFLTDVAAKNLGVAEVVQPRFPLLFEPPSRAMREPIDATDHEGLEDPAPQFEMPLDPLAQTCGRIAETILAGERTPEARVEETQFREPVLPTEPRAPVIQPRIQPMSAPAETRPVGRPNAPRRAPLDPLDATRPAPGVMDPTHDRADMAPTHVVVSPVPTLNISMDDRARVEPHTPFEQPASRATVPSEPPSTPTEFARVPSSPIPTIEPVVERPVLPSATAPNLLLRTIERLLEQEVAPTPPASNIPSLRVEPIVVHPTTQPAAAPQSARELPQPLTIAGPMRAQTSSLPRADVAQVVATEPAPRPTGQVAESAQPLSPTRPLPLTTIVAPPIVKLAPRVEQLEPRDKYVAPPPTIQVTIGRIEVRAVPPPTKPERAVSSTVPIMSLDDYLRRRAQRGGG